MTNIGLKVVHSIQQLIIAANYYKKAQQTSPLHLFFYNHH